MLNYRHVLIATDLSQETDKIADHAKLIAQHSGAKISIIHVVQHTPIVYGGGEFSIPLDINIEETLRQHAQQALSQVSSRLGIAEQDQYLETGSIKVAVVEVAQEIGADLIVVGTHGHRGIEKMLGSTANAILHAAKCDVLTVRVTFQKDNN